MGMEILHATVKQKLPVRAAFDAETTMTSDVKYTAKIFHKKNIDDILGIPDEKGWIKPPILRYYNEQVLEKVFNSIRKILKALPDKTYLKEKNAWYYVFTREKADQEMMKSLGLTPDKKLYTRYGKYYCTAERPGIQAAILLDSLPSLILQAIDDEESEGNDLALNARAFSKYLPRVKGYLKSKCVALIAINQVREAPMVRYGDPTYEPGGKAIGFNTDVRLRVQPRAVPEGWERGKDDEGNKSSAFAVEPSVYGKGEDQYVFRRIANTKNKTGIPYRKGWLRIWMKDHKGIGHGVDPVYDTYQYLQMTGQFIGSRKDKKGFGIALPEYKGIKFDWHTFKMLVLAEDEGDKELQAAVLKKLKSKKGKDLLSLRKKCFAQIQSGEAGVLYERLRNDDKVKADDE